MQCASLQVPNVPNAWRNREEMRVAAPPPRAPQECSVLDQALDLFAGMEESQEEQEAEVTTMLL